MIGIDTARACYVVSDREGCVTDAAHDFHHVLRVLGMAERIGHEEGADMDVVRAAALLHDVGRVHADRGECHAAAGARYAQRFLSGQPEERVAAVVHAIASHRYRRPPAPASLEAQVLFDADKLDSIGAVGVARAYAFAGLHGQRLWASTKEVDVERWHAEGDDPAHHTPVHEFVVKLQRLKDLLYTATGRRIAEGRHAFMVDFFTQLTAEVRGEA